jgi:hypothetical protein
MVVAATRTKNHKFNSGQQIARLDESLFNSGKIQFIRPGEKF